MNENTIELELSKMRAKLMAQFGLLTSTRITTTTSVVTTTTTTINTPPARTTASPSIFLLNFCCPFEIIFNVCIFLSLWNTATVCTARYINETMLSGRLWPPDYPQQSTSENCRRTMGRISTILAMAGVSQVIL